MQEFTHEEQVEIVRQAFSLETAIATERAIVELVREQEFARFPKFSDVFDIKTPKMPQRRMCQRPEQVQAVLPEPPKASYSIVDHLKAKPYWIALLIASIAAGLASITGAITYGLGLFLDVAASAVIIACAVTYFKEVKRKNEELANSPEYLQSVELAKQQAAWQSKQNELRAQQEQARLDAQYNAEVEHYNSVILPAFEQELEACQKEYAEMREAYDQDKAEWESKRNSAIALLEDDIATNESALSELYDSSGLISLHYREIPILEWLYDDMRSSDHDIRYATELLDRDRQRIATMEAGARTTEAIDRMRDEMHRDAEEMKMLQGVQIRSLQNLEDLSGEILYTTEDIYTSSKKILFHQRVNTIDIGLREWRYHKAKKAAKRTANKA